MKEHGSDGKKITEEVELMRMFDGKAHLWGWDFGIFE
jgi:hypothetical protein